MILFLFNKPVCLAYCHEFYRHNFYLHSWLSFIFINLLSSFPSEGYCGHKIWVNIWNKDDNQHSGKENQNKTLFCFHFELTNFSRKELGTNFLLYFQLQWVMQVARLTQLGNLPIKKQTVCGFLLSVKGQFAKEVWSHRLCGHWR